MHRRRLLTGVAAGMAALAGCSLPGGDTGTSTTDGGPTRTTTVTDTGPTPVGGTTMPITQRPFDFQPASDQPARSIVVPEDGPLVDSEETPPHPVRVWNAGGERTFYATIRDGEGAEIDTWALDLAAQAYAEFVLAADGSYAFTFATGVERNQTLTIPADQFDCQPSSTYVMFDAAGFGRYMSFEVGPACGETVTDGSTPTATDTPSPTATSTTTTSN